MNVFETSLSPSMYSRTLTALKLGLIVLISKIDDCCYVLNTWASWKKHHKTLASDLLGMHTLLGSDQAAGIFWAQSLTFFKICASETFAAIASVSATSKNI